MCVDLQLGFRDIVWVCVRPADATQTLPPYREVDAPAGVGGAHRVHGHKEDDQRVPRGLSVEGERQRSLGGMRMCVDDDDMRGE